MRTLIIILSRSPHDLRILKRKDGWITGNVAYLECDRGQRVSKEPITDAERVLCGILLPADHLNHSPEQIASNTRRVKTALSNYPASEWKIVIGTHTQEYHPDLVLNTADFPGTLIVHYTTAWDSFRFVSGWCDAIVAGTAEAEAIKSEFDLLVGALEAERPLSIRDSAHLWRHKLINKLGPLHTALDVFVESNYSSTTVTGMAQPYTSDLAKERLFEITKLVYPPDTDGRLGTRTCLEDWISCDPAQEAISRDPRWRDWLHESEAEIRKVMPLGSREKEVPEVFASLISWFADENKTQLVSAPKPVTDFCTWVDSFDQAMEHIVEGVEQIRGVDSINPDAAAAGTGDIHPPS